MKVLLLADRYPWPLSNGQNLRIYHYVRHLRSRHEFHFGGYGDQPAPDPILPLFASIRTWPKPIPSAARGIGRFIDALNPGSFVPSSPEARRDLVALLERESFDLIWVSGWDFIVNVPMDSGVPMLADAVDDGVLEYWRELRVERRPMQRLRLLKWVAMNFLFERRFFGPAALALFVAEPDARVFARVCPNTPVDVVNNGVDETYFKPQGQPSEPLRVIFEGNIGFAPNADGLVHFCQAIWPRIRAAMPGARFSIVGRDPSSAVRALAGDDVDVTGYVDDVRPYIDRASVFVCPLRKGAGIKNKVLQAWALAKPVVATTISAGGLRCDDGRNILLRDDPEAFANAVVDLLRDPGRAQRLGAEGRATVLAHYTWGQKARELESLIGRAARRLKVQADAAS